MHVAVDFLHALRTEISLGNHFHLYLRRLHRIALSDHRAKGAVAREVRVAGHQQVADIHAVVDAALDGMDGCQEARHLLHGIRHEHRLEVVAILQARADAGGDGVDVLQHTRVLNADDVEAGLCLDILAREHLSESLGLLLVRAAHGEIAQPLERHLLGMAGTADARQVVVGHIVHLMEILRAREILIGHDAFDGRHYKLVAQACLQLAKMVFQIGRGGDKHQRVVSLHYLVDIAREADLVDVEADTRQVGRVVAHAPEVLYTVVAAHIPPDVVRMPHHDLGYGRRPTTTANNGYFTTIVHIR